MMKKLLVGLCVGSCPMAVLAGEVIHGALSGASGAGYTTANYSEGVLLNPAQLVSQAPGEGGFALLLNAGALVSDEDDLQDQAEDLTDLTDDISSSATLSVAQAQELKSRLSGVDGDTAFVNLGGNLVLAIANKEYVSAALVAKAFTQVSITPEVQDSDLALIDSYINQSFDPSDESSGLESKVHVQGAMVTEVGIAFAKFFALGENKRLQVGVTPKRVEVESIAYTANVADYDDDDWDSDQYRVSESATDIDIGALYSVDSYRIGATVSNAKGNTFKTITPNKHIELKRQVTLATGYVKDWISAEVAYDITSTPAIGLEGDTRFLRAGVDLNVWKFVHLRGGFQQDTKNTLRDTYSVGLGLGVFSLAYITGDKNTEGVALGGGLRF